MILRFCEAKGFLGGAGKLGARRPRSDHLSSLGAQATILYSSEAICQVSNNRGEYADIGKTRFRLSARPIAPPRIFTTGSIYKTNYALPSGSYYGLQDAYTEEMEIPFDTSFTKISCDSTGPYFDVFMSGLQPERYYRILIKHINSDGTTIYDNDYHFKVIR